ncbi:MAG: Uma2 family endonuclease [Myxococcales bacterium]|nr:Uma2 family endonuclease [Myxococcales bacterium]
MARRAPDAYSGQLRAPSHHRYTWEQYIAIERDSPIKHEFLDGEIFAMAGGTPEHAALAAAVIGELGAQLEGKPCRVYTSDLRVKVLASGLATYPDAAVICGELQRDPLDKNSAVNPVVLVEVTSDSTEGYDRGEKFEHSRQMPSVSEYVLASHREPLVEVFRRGPSKWARLEARSGARVRLESIGCELAVDRLFAGIALHTE